MRGLFVVLIAAVCACSGPPSDADQARVEATPIEASAPSWVSSAVPLRSVEPGGSNADLAPLRSSFAGARVIAVGEGTHGSHEFHAMRERLLAWMITELGVRTLAIESSMAEVAQLDRYIQGDGEPHRAQSLVVRNSTWPWRVVEFARTLEWLRTYNAGREAAERVHMYGFDIQQPWVTLDYLSEAFAGRKRVERSLRSADIQRIAVTPARYQEYNEDERDRTRAALLELEADLRSAPQAADPLLLRTLETLSQVERHYRMYEYQGVSPTREQAMADNIRWIAQTFPSPAPIVVWAHNGHVSREPLHQSHNDAMGRHLAEHFGAGFVNVGFLFGQGAFLTRDRNLDDHPIRELRVPAGASGDLGPRLADGGLPRFVLDLRTLPDDEPLRAWLTEPRQSWVVGSAVTNPNKQIGDFDLLASFDLIVFVQNVRASVLVLESKLESERSRPR